MWRTRVSMNFRLAEAITAILRRRLIERLELSAAAEPFATEQV
jgi:hypothetical protein